MLECPATCPIVVSYRDDALSFPVGQLHRVGASNPDRDPREVDETKRNVLKLVAVAGVLGAAAGGLVGGGLQYAQPPLVGVTSFPRTQLIDIDGSALTMARVTSEYNISTGSVITFNYPLRNEPNFFLNLQPAVSGGPGATNVPYGIGPQKSVVAYSAICQHLGCPAPAIAYYPPGTCPQTPGGYAYYIHCSCHGSTYNAANQAANLTGPAVLPLPQVVLEWQTSDDTIFATGMTPSSPTVNGHLDTLLGDYSVGNSSPLVRQSPIILCSFP